MKALKETVDQLIKLREKQWTSWESIDTDSELSEKAFREYSVSNRHLWQIERCFDLGNSILSIQFQSKLKLCGNIIGVSLTYASLNSCSKFPNRLDPRISLKTSLLAKKTQTTDKRSRRTKWMKRLVMDRSRCLWSGPLAAGQVSFWHAQNHSCRIKRNTRTRRTLPTKTAYPDKTNPPFWSTLFSSQQLGNLKALWFKWLEGKTRTRLTKVDNED